LFKPEWISLLEEIIAITERLTPANSPLSALFKIVAKRLKYDVLKRIAQVPAAWFNLEHHVKSGSKLLPQTLSTHDEHLFAALRMSRSQEDVSPVLSERMHVAGQKRDATFTRKLNRAYRTTPIHPDKLLTDLQVGALKECLLAFWDSFPTGWEPRIGLSDFTYEAIGKFCDLVFDPKGQRTDDAFEAEKVRDAVRS
jgi:hypothetical protein